MMCMAFTGVLYGGGVLVNAQNRAPNEVIKSRIANFRKMGKAFKGIRDQVKRSTTVIDQGQSGATIG